MALIVDALDRIARQVSVTPPSSWITATDLEHVEIRDDFLREGIDDIHQRLDLPSPIGKQFVLTGDGSETYNLPSDYVRLQRDPMAVYETTNVRRACIPVTNDGEWTYLKEIGSTGGERYYRIQGYEGNHTISIYREPSSPISVTVSYISNLWMATASGTVGTVFSDETDVLLLPRRLVEIAAVVRWRDRKGVDTRIKRMEFEAEISRLSNDSRTRRTIHFGEPYTQRRPWDIPVPDQIPSG